MAAARHVGGEADLEAVLQELADRRDAGGKIHVRFRRMRDEHAVFLHHLLLQLARVDAVRHDAAVVAAEQAELTVGVAVALRARAELLHPRDLAEIFGQVALHGHIVLPPQPAEGVHEIVGTRRDEARRQDGLRALKFLRRLEPRRRVAHGLIFEISRR